MRHDVPSAWNVYPRDIAVDSVTGKITVGVQANGDFVLARYWQSGTLDTGFGWLGVTAAQSATTNERLHAIALHSTLGVVAVGTPRPERGEHADGGHGVQRSGCVEQRFQRKR